MYQLENILKNDKTKFKKLIVDTYKKLGIEEAIRIIKKSGISINPFGSGKPKDNVLFKEILEELYEFEQDNIYLKKFEEEVTTLNKLYKYFSSTYISKIESSLPNEMHVISYLISLEIFLIELQQNMFTNIISDRAYGLNNNAPDLYENIVQTTGLVLKYFLYKGYPFEGISRRVNRKYVLNAGEHFKCSEYRHLLDRILELWSYFETEVNVVDDVIKIKAVGDNALAKNISHMSFMDIRNAKISRHSYEEFILKQTFQRTNILPPTNFLSLNEKAACEFINEYLFMNDLTIEFDGISLAEYVRAYSVVEMECKKFMKTRKRINVSFKDIALNDVCIAKTKNKWINNFVEAGIRKSSARKILNFMTFSDQSNDLFDCPFIRIGNDYVVVPSASFITDSSRAILLNLNSKEINISIKGNTFENIIRETVGNTGIKCINLDKKDYECDAVFALENDLFFVEAKNLNHPTTYRDYTRNLDEIQEACVQLERIVNYYTLDKNISHIKSILGINRIDSVNKIVLTNTSQGEKLKFNDTYVIDDTLFLGYFNRRSPQIVEIDGNIVISRTLFEEYYEGNINTKQFIGLIEKSPLVESNKRRIEYRTFNYIESLGVSLTDFSVKINSIVTPDFMSNRELEEFNNIYNL
jgi:hypothetical protein